MNANRYCVYLNENARKISPEVVTLIEELVPPDDFFIASKPEDACRFAKTIIAQRYSMVFVGGGDGTTIQLINALIKASKEINGDERLPSIGVLSLGTGNALSSLVSSQSPIQDLKSYLANPTHDVWQISLVDWNGIVFPFASIGIDAEILSDYITMKETVGTGKLKPLFQNVGGYFLAFFAGTVPRHIKQAILGEDVEIEVTNLSDRAYQIMPDGQMGRSFGLHDIIYQGKLTALMIGTIPVYGYKLRILPYADRFQHFFQLRVAYLSALKGFINLPKIWKGKYIGDGIVDFYATKVRVDVSKKIPFQVGGDFMGFYDHFIFSLKPCSLNLIRFI